MAIYNIGSTYYLGDVKFGNYNISYPGISFLQGFPHNAISAEISALCTAAGLPFRNVLAQASFDSYATARTFLAFGANGDIDDRYTFGENTWTIGTSSAVSHVGIYNDSGFTSTTNDAASVTNRLVLGKNNDVTINQGLYFDTANAGGTASTIQWFGCANSRALALGNYQYNFGTGRQVLNFWYAGQLDGVTTDFNYYSANNTTKSIAIAGQWVSNLTANQKLLGYHYIANAQKSLLQSGFAEYALSGSSSQWSGDLLIHDNNTTLGFPTIGEASLLRVLGGTYTLNKPAQLTGDVANRLWLPIAPWTTNRMLAVEVYSS